MQDEITQDQIRQVQSLIGQAATVVQSIRLLAQTQARAQHERVLREVTARVRSSTDPDVVLRTAVRELGQVLGRNVLIRLGSSEEANQGGAEGADGGSGERS